MKPILISVKHDDTLLNYLLNANLDYSRTKIKSLLKHQCILVNDTVVSQFDEPIAKGETIKIVQHNDQLDLPFPLLYEDRNIIVIDKPYGLLTISTEKKEPNTAFRAVSQYVKKKDPRNKIYVIHRLDKNTSGVVMFAKSEAVQKAYQENWNDRVKERMYVAIVEGHLDQDTGTVESFLKENKTTHMYSSNSGQHAITHYRTIRKGKDFTVLAVHIDTGRKNQIRVHMQDLKTPILGDRKYDATRNPLNRMALHAYRLKIENPFTHKMNTYVAPIPRQFTRYARITESQIKSI
ncbi:pseudouridine synthase [Erysipelothrix larvae]|uniref:RNA pseudouridylate synthase n=1 Tax=Erysipelothrix larvae TaxID=1514105 RepID=A0A0X8GY98_9FIRM|nr:RluA family pseudouridine synthase [Erysipelothrix larvae]AMC92633.1 pseudouridine synthase [Erysipelothrix larvae]